MDNDVADKRMEDLLKNFKVINLDPEPCKTGDDHSEEARRKKIAEQGRAGGFIIIGIEREKGRNIS